MITGTNVHFLEQIENLSGCTELKVLDLSENSISNIESIRHVVSIPQLRVLDLSSNKLNGEYQALLEILAQCSHLEVLSLKGNPITKTMADYRKLVVSKCSELKSLDGREICSEERRRCNAWGSVIASGGSKHEAEEADRLELIKIGAEKSEKNAKRRRDA
jgi:Leucine-rich repeat (LRR) protein